MNNLKYFNFINENLETENGEKELVKIKKPAVKAEKKFMKLFLSQELQDVLEKMLLTRDYQVSEIINKIINIDETPEQNRFEISYLDIDHDKDDAVTFLSAQRCYTKMGWKTEDEANQIPPDNSPLWTTTGRQSLGIGKLVNKLFKDVFTDVAVNKFLKIYKAEISSKHVMRRFSLVKGEDIRFWYLESNYYKDPGDTQGQLLKSCMRHQESQNWLNIYCNNPEKCSLLILKHHEVNKIIGRAIIWHNLRKPPEETFMDRIYTTYEADVELFKKYAIQQGWLYKYNQAAHDSSYVENGQRIYTNLTVELTPMKYDKYPYLDTLKYYTPQTGRLASDPGLKVKDYERIKCENASGGFERI